MASISVDEDRFDRQKRVSGWNQGAVENARVLVAGAGALGNEVVKLLLQLGVKKIAVVDYDVVVRANLNRCVFFNEGDAENQVLKVEALAREAKKLYPNVELEAIPTRIEFLDEAFYKQFDYAFGCLDSIGARLQLNAFCYGVLPLIDGGTTGFMGKVQVVKAPSSCVECGLSKRDYKLFWQRYSCFGEMLDFVDPKMPALPTTTSVVAGIQVNEFLKLAHGNSLAEQSLVGKFLFLNGLKQSAELYEVPKRAGCPVH